MRIFPEQNDWENRKSYKYRISILEFQSVPDADWQYLSITITDKSLDVTENVYTLLVMKLSRIYMNSFMIYIL